MERICHYTSFSTLKLIIENKTIRLNSLKNVDDCQEAYTKDFGDQSAYFFASCWTYDSNENLPLWSMYVKDRFAVRLEIDVNFLEFNINKKHQITNHTSRNAFCYPIFRDGGKPVPISKIDYRDDPYISVCENLLGFISKDYIKSFGIIKKKIWDFQKECRFLLQATPIKYAKHRKNVSYFINHLESIDNNRETEIEYIDVYYEMNKLCNANFMLGPSTTQEDYIELKDYISKKIPNFIGKIERSDAYTRDISR